MKTLYDTFIQICIDTAKNLAGHKRRADQAKITQTYLQGSARRAESLFGWARATVALGLKELESG